MLFRSGTMTIAAAHAVCTGIGLAALPHIILEDPMFKDVLRPVLVTHPVRNSHLYAIYVSRQQPSLKIRTFIEHVVEHTRIPHPWNDLSGVDPKHSNHGMPVVTLFPT